MTNILAFVDSPDSEVEVLRMAGTMARAFGANVCLVHIIDPESDYDGDELRVNVSRGGLADEIRRKRRALRLAAVALIRQGAPATSLLVRGPPARKAFEELKRRKADWVVLGKQRHGRLRHLFQGSVGATVLRHATCPVLIVPLAPAATPTPNPSKG